MELLFGIALYDEENGLPKVYSRIPGYRYPPMPRDAIREAFGDLLEAEARGRRAKLEAELVAARSAHRRSKPLGLMNIDSVGSELPRAAVGDDSSIGVGEYQIVIHRVRIEDHSHASRGVFVRLWRLLAERVDNAAVRCPPADIASTFVKVAID